MQPPDHGNSHESRSSAGWARRYRLQEASPLGAWDPHEEQQGLTSVDTGVNRWWSVWVTAQGGDRPASMPWRSPRFTRHVRNHLPATLRHGIARWWTDVAAEVLRRSCATWQPELLLPELERVECCGPPQHRAERLARRGQRLRKLLDHEWPSWSQSLEEADLLYGVPGAGAWELAWRASRCALEWVPSEARAALCAYVLALMPPTEDAPTAWVPTPALRPGLGLCTATAIAWIEAHRGRWTDALQALRTSGQAWQEELTPCVLVWWLASMAGDTQAACEAALILESLVWPADPRWQAWLDVGASWKLTAAARVEVPTSLRARQLHGAFFAPERETATRD